MSHVPAADETPDDEWPSQELKESSIKFLGWLVGAWILTGIGAWLVSPGNPQLDANTQAFVDLANSVESGSFNEMAYVGRQVQSSTTDPELRTLADFIARAAETNLGRNIRTLEQKNSWSGWIRDAWTGYTNPLAAIEELGMSIDFSLGGVQDVAKSVNDRYRAQLESYSADEQRRATIRKWSWAVFLYLGYQAARYCFFARDKSGDTAATVPA